MPVDRVLRPLREDAMRLFRGGAGTVLYRAPLRVLGEFGFDRPYGE